MPALPNAEGAILDARKLDAYCLNPAHPRGRHKARVFREALGLHRDDASWLSAVLLGGILRTDAEQMAADRFGSRWRVDLQITHGDRNAAVRTIWIVRAGGRRTPVRYLLGALMLTEAERTEPPHVLDVVALLQASPLEGLATGQVGTVVDLLDAATVLVEFSDEAGRAYAIVPCRRSDLLTLRYVPQAA